MPKTNWMIYGAYGYSGELIAKEAVRRGHHPLLAGRSLDKLSALAKRLDLPYLVVNLQNGEQLAEAVSKVELVCHAAGPFIHTSQPMRQACLEQGVHYVDITGEIPVLESTLACDADAREKGVALISGIGFDVVPTDCMAAYVSAQVAEATNLEIAFSSISHASIGTTKSMLEMLPNGNWVRRNGKLVPYPFGKGARRIRFSDRERTVLPIPWGDLATAYRTTGIPNITTYMAFPRQTARLIRLGGPIFINLLAVDLVRNGAKIWVEKSVKNPDEHLRSTGRSYIWACANNQKGKQAQAWLETLEGYRFTAVAAVRCVEKILALRPVGALTPSQAFGADFVLEIEGTHRFDQLPGSSS